MSHDITIARQVAALRESGWSTLDALGLVIPALAPGPERAALERAAQRLQRGEPPGGDDLLEALLSRGDAASPAALECLAEAFEAARGLGRERRRAAQMLGTFVIGPLLLASLAGWLEVGSYFSALSPAAVPASTELMLSLLEVAKWAGPALCLAAVALFALLARRAPRGGRAYEGAAQLLQLASALEANQPEAAALGLTAPAGPPRSLAAQLRLDPQEALFVDWARQTIGLAAGARALAQEKLLEARERQLRFEQYAPPLLAMLLGMFIGSVVIALYLPIFTIASSIK